MDEWISLLTDKGHVLATPTPETASEGGTVWAAQTVVVAGEPLLVPIVPVVVDAKGKKGKKAAKKGKKYTQQDRMSNPMYDDGED